MRTRLISVVISIVIIILCSVILHTWKATTLAIISGTCRKPKAREVSWSDVLPPGADRLPKFAHHWNHWEPEMSYHLPVETKTVPFSRRNQRLCSWVTCHFQGMMDEHRMVPLAATWTTKGWLNHQRPMYVYNLIIGHRSLLIKENHRKWIYLRFGTFPFRPVCIKSRCNHKALGWSPQKGRFWFFPGNYITRWAWTYINWVRNCRTLPRPETVDASSVGFTLRSRHAPRFFFGIELTVTHPRFRGAWNPAQGRLP